METFLTPDHLISDEIKTYCRTLRTFVDRQVLPHEDEFDDYWDWTERKEHTFVEDILKKLLIDLGFQKAYIPPQYGGTGGWSMVEKGAINAELARGDRGFYVTSTVTSWAVASVMLPTPNDRLMKQLAEWLCGNEPFMICSALTEPHGGGAVEDMRLKALETRTRARLEGNEWVINGHKLWPSGYREAKAFQVVCSVEGEKFPNNIAQFIVPADTPGVSTGKPYRKMGCAIDTNGDVWFENVRVSNENRLHEGEDEVKSLVAKATLGRASSSSTVLGTMRRAYEILKSYVDNREIGGKPMKEHGAIVHELGQIVSDILSAESIVWNTLGRLDHPEVYGPPWDHKQLVTASSCHNAVTGYGLRVINRAVELHGFLRVFQGREDGKAVKGREGSPDCGGRPSAAPC